MIPVLSPSPASSQAATGDRFLLRLATMLRETGFRFTTVTPETHRRVNARPENAVARTLEDVFGWSRPFQPDLLPQAMFETMQDAGVVAREGDLWRSLVRFSSLHGLLFVHSAYPTVETDAVFFGPDTYRFASAITQYLAMRVTPPRRTVDVGCGAGPGGIVVAQLTGSRIVMVDINDQALRFARINATQAGLGGSADILHSDLLGSVNGDFDLIVANPPYILDPLARAYRHGGGPLGAGLSFAIAEAGLRQLAPGGALLLYTGAAIVQGRDPFREALARMIADTDLRWSYREVDPDVFGEELDACAYAEVDRIAAVVSIMEKPDKPNGRGGNHAA